jgi:hypothetical protein
LKFGHDRDGQIHVFLEKRVEAGPGSKALEEA